MTEIGTATAVSLMRKQADDMQAEMNKLYNEAEELKEQAFEAEGDADTLSRELRSLREAIDIMERTSA